MLLEELIAGAQKAERVGAWNRSVELYKRAISEAGEAGDVVRLAELHRWIGRVYRLRGDLVLAAQAYRASLAIAEANNLTLHIASALNVIAMIEQLHGNVDAAEGLYMRARGLAIQTGDQRLVAMIEQNFATMANIRGETDAALESYAVALKCYQNVNDDLACAYALNNMGMSFTDRGDWNAGKAHFQMALDYASRAGDTEIRGTIHLNLAELHLKAGDLDAAHDHCGDAYAVFGRLQSKTALAETYKLYSAIYRTAGKPQLAETHLDVIVDLARNCEDRLLEAEIEHERALLHLSEGRSREALMALNSAHEIFLSFKARNEVIDIDKRLDRLESTFLEVVRAWGESIESKDRYTAGHCGRVADYTCMLAAALGFKERDLNWVRMGAFLHDVGKTGVPSEILNKPDRLTEDEMEQLKKHTVIGDAVISETPFPWDIRPIIRNHHEHWDGTGYPDGLKGENIPLTARMLCVADVYDALTTARSYRGALTREEAFGIMDREAGTVLDPELYGMFKELVTAEPLVTA